MNQTRQYKMVEVDDCVCSTATAKAILVVCEGERLRLLCWTTVAASDRNHQVTS